MKKTLFLTLVAAAFLSLGTAFAQNKPGKVPFYQVVPKHEFFIEGFGGLGPILFWGDKYAVRTDTPEPSFELDANNPIQSLWPWVAAHYDDMFTLKNLTGLGYGGGFGYIAHITPVVGIMTGAEFAVYNSGLDIGYGATGAYRFWAWTAQVLNDGQLRLAGLGNYREYQKYMAVQVPLMLHLMAPMGKGKNFFYAAFGAKVGFNIPQLSYFHGQGAYYQTLDLPDPGTDWIDLYESEAGGLFADLNIDGKNTFAPDDPEYLTMLNWAGDGEGGFINDGEYDAKGRLGARLVNPMASLEMGFRWRFGGGWGLYTGLYADLGILPLTKPDGAIVKVIQQEGAEPMYEPQSLLCAEGLPTYQIRSVNTDGVEKIELRRDNLPAALQFTRSFQAGLKMKLAFGKVKKNSAPVPVILPPKPDTVVKTVVQTVVVRDTVTRQNTVVVRDTVEKVKVVRDTVIVIKEVPQEIKDVMVELSNTLFAFNKFNLTDKAKAGLDKVAAWLNDNPDVQVEISGHTDSVGSDSYNQKLSEDRAKSVYEYFIHEGGVSSRRLSYKGYGESRPIATNETDAGRQQNRRVELNIIQ